MDGIASVRHQHSIKAGNDVSADYWLVAGPNKEERKGLILGLYKLVAYDSHDT